MKWAVSRPLESGGDVLIGAGSRGIYYATSHNSALRFADRVSAYGFLQYVTNVGLELYEGQVDRLDVVEIG